MPQQFSALDLLRRMQASSMAAVTAAGLLLSLAGCLPGLHCAEQGPKLPADYYGKTDAANSANVGIDEFFGDPMLTHLICEGLARNQELKIRNQEIQIASNEILARRGAYLPFVGVRASGGFDRTSKFTPLGAAEEQLTYPGEGHFPDPLTNTRISADLFWRIDIWRELRNARDAAMQRYVAAVERRDYFVTRLVAEIAENYYRLAALDMRLEFLNQTIDLQQQSLEVAEAQKQAARGTELGVQRFLAEVRKNESQRLIVRQSIIEVENRINVLVGRYPQAVERVGWNLISLDSRPLSVGVPSQLLLNRRDIRAAEREVAASGLDVLVARARFFPTLDITAGIGFEAFNPRYLFDPGAFIARTAGDLAAPLINRAAIKADYMNANARQIQALYDYQRTVIIAFTEVANAVSKVENYRRSVEIKLGQVQALEASVEVAKGLFNSPILEEFARVEYVDVLLATRDLLDARTDLVDTKQEQLSAIVNAYQSLGGGYLLSNSGKTFAELYCPPVVIDPGQVPLAPHGLEGQGLMAPPTESEKPDESGKATVTMSYEATSPQQATSPPADSWDEAIPLWRFMDRGREQTAETPVPTDMPSQFNPFQAVPNGLW